MANVTRGHPAAPVLNTASVAFLKVVYLMGVFKALISLKFPTEVSLRKHCTRFRDEGNLIVGYVSPR